MSSPHFLCFCGGAADGGCVAATESTVSTPSQSIPASPAVSLKLFRPRVPSIAQERRVNVVASRSRELSTPSIHTYRCTAGFVEDSIVRHIEPTHAGHLELRRLSNFVIRLVPTPNPAVHVYEATPKHEEADARGPRATARSTLAQALCADVCIRVC